MTPRPRRSLSAAEKWRELRKAVDDRSKFHRGLEAKYSASSDYANAFRHAEAANVCDMVFAVMRQLSRARRRPRGGRG